MSNTTKISTLTLQHTVLDPESAWFTAEVRPLIDGRDVLHELHPDGLVSDVRSWAGAPEGWPLAVREEERRVLMAGVNCMINCCGGVWATLRRAGGLIVWADWENTTGGPPAGGDVFFDAAQYERELVRAANDLSWEERADTVARLLERELRDSGWFERWGCSVDRVIPRREDSGWRGLPEGVDVSVDDFSGREGEGEWGYDYALTMTPGESAQEAARRFAENLLAHSPQEAEELWGEEW